MKGFHNILVHEYGGIDNAIVFKTSTVRMADFGTFRQDILRFINPKP
jgi:uncharacterized protein YutE (UPF0331/DUF86 family)